MLFYQIDNYRKHLKVVAVIFIVGKYRDIAHYIIIFSYLP